MERAKEYIRQIDSSTGGMREGRDRGDDTNPRGQRNEVEEDSDPIVARQMLEEERLRREWLGRVNRSPQISPEVIRRAQEIQEGRKNRKAAEKDVR